MSCNSLTEKWQKLLSSQFVVCQLLVSEIIVTRGIAPLWFYLLPKSPERSLCVVQSLAESDSSASSFVECN